MQRRVLLVDIRNHLNPVFDQTFVVKNIIWNRSVHDWDIHQNISKHTAELPDRSQPSSLSLNHVLSRFYDPDPLGDWEIGVRLRGEAATGGRKAVGLGREWHWEQGQKQDHFSDAVAMTVLSVWGVAANSSLILHPGSHRCLEDVPFQVFSDAVPPPKRINLNDVQGPLTSPVASESSTVRVCMSLARTPQWLATPGKIKLTPLVNTVRYPRPSFIFCRRLIFCYWLPMPLRT